MYKLQTADMYKIQGSKSFFDSQTQVQLHFISVTLTAMHCSSLYLFVLLERKLVDVDIDYLKLQKRLPNSVMKFN